MKLLLALLLFLLPAGVVVGDSTGTIELTQEQMDRFYGKTNPEYFNPGPKQRAPEACVHEFLESEYVVQRRTYGNDQWSYWYEDINLSQCQKCGTLSAPIRLKGERP